MKQRITALVCALLLVMGATAQTGGYNPGNPPEPQLRQKLTVTTLPVEAGTASGSGEYAEGTKVSVRTSGKSGYTFRYWTLNGDSVDYAQNFTYTMTDEPATLVAVYSYHYSPSDPFEPQPIDPVYKLNLQSSPDGSCTFSPSGVQSYKAGTAVRVSAYPQTGYVLLGWYDADSNLLSTSSSFSYTMPAVDMVLMARLEYSPSSPNDPQGGQTDVDGDKNTVSVTAWSYTREYGEENPVFDYTVTGEQLVGTPVVTCEATASTPVGSYPVVVGKGTIENAFVNLVNGTLTVTRAPLTIRVGNYTIKQGEPLPDFTLTYEGFKNGETAAVLTAQPVVACEATSASAPGDYPITVSGGEAQNYALGNVGGVLTITEADAVVVTARSNTREYGDENPVFEYTAEGAPLDGTPEIICEATQESPVGTYPIIIKKGSVKNYNDSYINGTLTITPATLTASVGDYSRQQGEDNPVFTILYSGWKNGEDESVLAEKPTAVCEATAESELSDYPIIVSGGEAQNYVFEYVNGTLTVTAPSGIAELQADGKERRIYTISGRRISQPQRGVNIIVTSDGRRVKVMSK